MTLNELWIMNHATWEPLRPAMDSEIQEFGDSVFDMTFEGMLVRAQIAPKSQPIYEGQ
jgi:hypothetical protein